MKSRWLKVSMLILLVIASIGYAQKKETVFTELKAFKVVKANNVEKFVNADKAKPGDIIEYRVVTNNTGKNGVRNLVITLPIPVGMEYLNSSAKPQIAKASLDGKNFANAPLKKKVQGKEVLIPYSEYRSIRWNPVDLGANKSVEMRARVKVSLPAKKN